MSKAKLPQRSTMIVLAAVVAIVVGIGIYSSRDTIFASKKAAAGPTSVIVKTETVRPDKTIADKIIQNMSVDAEKRVELLPRVTGRLLALSVKQGDYVRKGEQVATLEHDQQNALILSTAAQAASARADTEKAKAQMLNAKTNLERYRRLEKEGFSTKQQLETMETEYTSAAASYRAAQAKERQYEAEAARVQSAKDDYIIRAPLDGIVLNDYSLTPGAMISPSSPILDIADLIGDQQIIVDALCDLWGDAIAPPTPQVRRVISAWAKRIDDFSIRYAIDETSIAPQPSLRYFLSICRRIEAEKEKKGNV